MMQYQLLTAAAAFLLGLFVGSLALGQKDDPPLTEEMRHSRPQDPVSAFAIREGNSDNSDSPVSGQDTDPLAADASRGGNGPVSIDLGPISESEQIRILTTRWANQESLVSRLEERVRDLERQLLTLRSERNSEKEEPTEAADESMPVVTPEDRRVALVAAGVTQTTAEEIVWRQSELELERLELLDQARREDWYRTDRYYEALSELNRDAIDLRAKIGEQAYDEYLYQTGEFNRVKVISVIQGSAAEHSGLLPGDIIESYGDERIYDYQDLRGATADGERGERVPVLIRRGDSFIEADISRGPIGVRLESFSASPSG